MKSEHIISRILPAALAIALGAPGLQAAVVLDTGTPNGFAFYSDPDAGQILGVALTLGAPATIRQVTWWGTYFGAASLNGTDNFTISFYGFAGAVPDTLPQLTHSMSPTRVADGTSNGAPQYRYASAIPDTNLAAGSYFVSIVNDLNDPDDDWGWSRVNSLQPFFKKSTLNGPWTQLASDDDKLAVILADDLGGNGGGGGGGNVPEPGTFGLLAAGAAVLFALRRKI